MNLQGWCLRAGTGLPLLPLPPLLLLCDRGIYQNLR